MSKKDSFEENLLKTLKGVQSKSDSKLDSRVLINISKEELDYMIYMIENGKIIDDDMK